MTNIKKYIHIVRVFLFLSCLLVIQGCHALTDHDDSYDAQSLYKQNDGIIAAADDKQLSKQQKKLYRQDAEIMALRYINKKDSTQTEIPASLINTLYNGLIHIVTSGQIQVNEFTKQHPIHVHHNNSTREILVFTDSTANWLKAWGNGVTQTGNTEIDKLIERFDLLLIDYSEVANVLPTTMATLRSSRALNTFAVSRLFQLQKDVKNAEPNSVFGDGSDIRVLFFDDHLRFTFDLGFGDCIAGCISRHFWKYNVYHDGSVEFIKEEGALLPD